MIAKPTPKLKVPKPLKGRPHLLSASLRAAVLERDNSTCRWCLVPGGRLDIHHVLPRGRGGKDTLDNLVSVHRLCHAAIHANPIEAITAGVTA